MNDSILIAGSSINPGDKICRLNGVIASSRFNFFHTDRGFGQRLAVSEYSLPEEVWADMFVNWIYDSYIITGHENPNIGFRHADIQIAAIARREWMNKVMRNYL